MPGPLLPLSDVPSTSASSHEVIERGISAIATFIQADWASLSLFSPLLPQTTWIYRHPSPSVWAEILAQTQEKVAQVTILTASDLSLAIQSSLLIPLEWEEQLLGIVGFYSRDWHYSWSKSVIELGKSTAAQISLILQQSQAYEKVKELAERETLVNNITSAIRSSLEPQAIFAAITHELGEALQVDGCALSLWTKTDKFVRCVGLYDRRNPPRSLPQSFVPIADNLVLQELLTTCRPVILDDLTVKPELQQFDLPLQSVAKALLIAPLLIDGEIIGSISLRQIEQVRQWSSSEIALVQAVAQQAAIAVQQSHLYHLSQHQARQLQESEQKVKQLNQYLTESVLKRFLPASIVNQVAAGELVLDLNPEPRFITLLFTDIVDFTLLANQLDCSHLATLLNEYLAAMTETVFSFGGTVDKFIGDAILALFGAPEPLSPPEQIKRAISTARSMHQRLEKLNQDWLERGLVDGQNIPLIQFRCGIHQGNAVVGMFGGQQRCDYTAIGSTVNIAARLQEAAPPNGILVSQTVATYLSEQDIVRRYFLKLKGMTQELLAFSVL